MLKVRQWFWVIVALALLAFGMFVLNFYLLNRLGKEQQSSIVPGGNNIQTTSSGIHSVIRKKAASLSPVYANSNPRSITLKKQLLTTLRPAEYENLQVVFQTANLWPVEHEIYPDGAELGQLIKALQHEEILKTYNSNRGTQLKLVLKLKHGQPVLFKPAWYARDRVIEGQVYTGKDRHNSEIVSFYLGAILNFRWTPIAVGRKIDLSEVHRKADTELRNTMTIKDNRYCVYGKCHYCTPDEPVCGIGEKNLLEGAILYLIPGTLQKHLSPWQRTYKADKLAGWEKDPNYCQTQKKKLSMTRLLDIIDIAIFDYLIQNGDRHRHESRNGRLTIIDNGKGFGNPHVDHLDILAPLYQCCIIRKSTWERLKLVSGGSLTDILNYLTKSDLLYPLLTDLHLQAMEKRLLNVFATTEICVEKYGKEIFH